jgi:dimethylaniline monooxygenase (N-oxide forming)
MVCFRSLRPDANWMGTGNFTLAVIPIVLLGTINLVLYLYSTLLDIVRAVTGHSSVPSTPRKEKMQSKSNGYVRL